MHRVRRYRQSFEDEREFRAYGTDAIGEWKRSALGRFLLLAALMLLPGGLARGQESSSPLPFTANTPPPAWVKPGLRLTFHTAASTNRSGQWEFVPDAGGSWVDGEGNSYSRTAPPRSHGLLQANIVALDEKQATTQMLFFLFDGMNLAEPLQKFEFGYVESASTCGDLWLHPDALRELLKDGVPELLIRPVKKTIDNATYDGVMIYSKSPKGHSVWIYDLASGVLLYSSKVTEVAPKWTADGGVQLASGGKHVLFTTFKGSRYPTLPWKDEPAPAWLKNVEEINYQAQFCVRQPGVPDTPLPFEIRMKVAERGSHWLRLNASTVSGMPGEIPGFGARVSGNHQLGGLWVPPRGLAVLTQGQELDADPMTHVTTRVAQKTGEAVTITQAGPRQQFDFTYRLSDGLLIGCSVAERLGIPGMSNVIEFQLAGMK